MAISLLRLRRAVSLSTTLLTRHPLAAPPSLSATASAHRNPSPATAAVSTRHFRTSPLSLYSARQSFRNNNGGLDDEIGPDTILFEGCDYNHWLITMDFPKDPAPTREEMIETYLQTLAKVVGSYEEAKKKMYACSTTTYQGFQCLVSEEESEKFKGLPGVVFILPDSYIDPVNKEYGGDKYDNGVITPRPPPMQYGRQGGRYGDRNRDFNRYPRQTPNEQGARGYDNQGPRNFGQQQNPSVPNQQGNRGYGNQQPGYGDSRNFGQQNNPQVPNQQPNPAYANQQPNPAYANQGPTSGVNRNFGQEQNPPVHPSVGGERRDAMPPYRANNFNQNHQGYYNPQGERVPPQQTNYAGDDRNYAPSQGQGQGSGGNYGQRPEGNYGQGAPGNQPRGFDYQQNQFGNGEGNRTAPMEQRKNNAQAEQMNYGHMGQTGSYQGRY